MKDLFTGQFCPMDCDRRPPVPPRDYLQAILRKIPSVLHDSVLGPLASGHLVDFGWDPRNKTFYAGMVTDPKDWGLHRDRVLICDWVVRYQRGGVPRVLKNRAGGHVSIDDIPDSEEP